MKIMMGMVHNEKEIVERILNGEYSSNELGIRTWAREINMLIRYYYINDREFMKADKNKFVYHVSKIIADNINKADNRADKVADYAFVEDVNVQLMRFYRVHLRKRYDVRLNDIKGEDIKIYKEELDVIEGCKTKTMQQLLFAYLVYAKIYKATGLKYDYVWEKITKMFHKANLQVHDMSYRISIIRKLIDEGYLSIDKERFKGNYLKVEFLKEKGEVAFTIEDLNNPIFSYLKFKGEKWVKCQGYECDEYFLVPKGQRKAGKYCCEECAKLADRIKARERMRKKRLKIEKK